MANSRDTSFCSRINTPPDFVPWVPTSKSDYLAVVHQLTPYVSVYPWSASGFGTKYADPAVLPTGTGRGVGFTSSSDAIIVGHDTTPYVSAYAWSGAGFGTKYADPTAVPAATWAMDQVRFSPTDAAVVASFTNFTYPTPCIAGYPWNSTTGFGTQMAPPVVPSLVLQHHDFVFSPKTGSIIIMGGLGAPYFQAYTWDDVVGFGVKYINPIYSLPNTSYGVAVNTHENTIAMGHTGSPWITVVRWSVAGWGDKYPNPLTLPLVDSSVFSTVFSPDDTVLFIVGGVTQYLEAYYWDDKSGLGAKYSNPSTLVTGVGQRVVMSAAGDFVAIAHNTTPFITVYPWDNTTGFGTKLTNPATLPPSEGRSCAFGNTPL